MARRPALIKRKPKVTRITRSEAYIVNRKHLGDEPVFTKPLTRLEYSQAMNWYNYMATSSEAREYVIEYLKSTNRFQEAKKVKSLSDNKIPQTLAWSCRLLTKGYKIPAESVDLLKKMLNNLLSYEEEITEEKTSVVSIQDRMKERSREIIGEIEENIDQFIHNGVEFSLYTWMQSNSIPSSYGAGIINKLSPVLNELIEAYEGKCEQLKEAYSRYKKTEIKKFIEFYNTLIEDAERYSSNTKKVRTARKPRTISVEKKIKNLKYQKEDQTYKIASISPEKVVGAMELWMFNTKYKTLTVLRAIDRAGLQVKGTSIINYCEKQSMTKSTGRKPEEYIKRTLEGGKIILKKIMDELKTDKPIQYRSNENTILLRIIQ